MMREGLRCRVCNSAKLVAKPFGYRFAGKWLQAVGCKECAIIFLDPQPTSDEIVQLYSKEYFEGDFRCGHAGSYFDDASINTIVDEPLLERIRKARPEGRLLEVGCAGGAFLHAAQTRGYTVRGVEFSEDAAQHARQKFGLDVLTGDLQTAQFPGGAFDIVFMGDVVEHLPDPVATLNEINRILREQGLLVLVCPTQTNTLFSRIGFALYSTLGKNATVNLPPYHLFEYRPNSLDKLLHRSRCLH
jgi:SAM-dependent methyltransferase